MTGRLARRGADRGALSLELAILAPGLIIMLALVVIAGRVSQAATIVDSAARAASRSASLERDGASARQKAIAVANSTLTGQGVRCVSNAVDVPSGGFQAPLGTPAAVTVTVVCTVNLSDAAFPGVPGTKQLRSSFTSPIDPYRQRP